MERACEIDRAWFEAYPGGKSYLRPAIPGEFGPFHTDAEAWGDVTLPREIPDGWMVEPVVEVVQVVPGQRMRAPRWVIRPADLLCDGQQIERLPPGPPRHDPRRLN
jgi:hypothetical protein